MSKILLTGGCSFSECIGSAVDTWPRHLFKKLQNYNFVEHVSSAMGSQGNGLISRGIIYSVSEALKKYKSDDILVGVMWSHANRVDYRCSNPNLLSWGNRNLDGWIENPTSFVKAATKNWVILNSSWKSEEAEVYYKHFFDYIGSVIYSIEHVLRTQYYLKSKGIKYFFTDFVDNNIIDFTSGETELFKDEINHLYAEIDKSFYLPVSSEHRWIYDNSKTKEQFLRNHIYNKRLSQWIHPNTEQHKEFTEEVIMPWLIDKNYI